MIRIQMYGAFVPQFQSSPIHQCLMNADNLSSLTALINALSDLDQLFESIEGAYLSSLQYDTYERWQEQA